MAELRNYEPSWRQKLIYALTSLTGDDRRARERAETAVGLTGAVVPPFEAILQGNEAAREAQGGRYGQAAGHAGLAAANILPFVVAKPVPARMRGHLGDDVAYATHEFMPGANTGHMTGLKENAAATRAFDDHSASTWATAPGGRDAIYDALGVKAAPSRDMQGVYRNSAGEMEFNRGQVALPGSGTPSKRMNDAESFRGYMDAQEGAAWHKLSGNGGDAVRIPIDRRMTSDEARAMSGAAEQRGLGAVDTGGGVTLKDFSFTKSPEDIAKMMPEIAGDVRRIMPEAKSPFQKSFDGDYIDYSGAWAQPGSGAATRQLRDQLGSSLDAARLDAAKPLRGAATMRNVRDREIAGQHGLPVREDVMRARDIFAKDGLKGLFDALDKGVILPGAAAMIVGAGALKRDEAPFVQGD